MTEIVRNQDNDHLLPSGNSQFVIGYVDEVNGEGAEEIAAAFVPTRAELLQLARYWTERVLDLEYTFFLFTSTGSYECRILGFGTRRIERIRAVLGAEAVDAVEMEVYKEYAKTIDPREWATFLNGDEARVDAFQEAGGPFASQLDWTWIEQEAERHRRGECSRPQSELEPNS